MEPRHLVQLAEIIDRGSLARAAKFLNVSQPTLTRNMQSLEALIGGPVLRRGRYGVNPTAIGLLLAKEGRAVRDALNQANLSLGHWKNGLEGRLRIGVGTMIAHSLMARFLERAAAGRWNVALWIDVGGANRLIDHLRLNELDLAIVQFDPEFSKEGLAQIALCDDRRAYYSGETHELARRKRITEEEISRALHVTVGAFSDQRQRACAEPVPQRDHGPKIELSGDVSIALHLLSTGKYIAALPEVIMNNLCDHRKFVKLAYSGAMPRRTFSIWYKEDMGGHPLLKEFCLRFRKFVAEAQKPK